MSTYSCSLQHIVFATKGRIPCISHDKRNDLIKFIWAICKNKKCEPLAINGHLDHLHILVYVHPSVSVSELVRIIKTSSNSMIKEKNLFPNFTSWQSGFGNFSCSIDRKESLIRYVLNQDEHHKKISSQQEIISFLEKCNIQYDPKYFN